MSLGEFEEGMDTIAGFIDRIFKVFKDAYLFIKEQIEGYMK